MFLLLTFDQKVSSKLVASLMDSTEIVDMVCPVTEAFICLNTFNVDVREVYDQIFDLLCLQMKLLIIESKLELLIIHLTTCCC